LLKNAQSAGRASIFSQERWTGINRHIGRKAEVFLRTDIADILCYWATWLRLTSRRRGLEAGF